MRQLSSLNNVDKLKLQGNNVFLVYRFPPRDYLRNGRVGCFGSDH